MSLRVVFASPRAESLAEFMAGLEAAGALVSVCATGALALDRVRDEVPDLVVVDGGLPDLAAAELVFELLKVNAAIPSAVLSRLPDEAFHAAAEGLGILARVAWEPGREDAASLLAALRVLNP
jgi:two-component system KDP operon response regulator KdpE